MNSITIIGDIHGLHDQYYQIACKNQFTVQLGDFGFEYETLKKISSDHHKVIGGNHDNYDIISEFRHYLGDYGNVVHNNIKFFFIRGEYSVDWPYRIEGHSWWRNEELTYQQMSECLKDYEQSKPNIILSHGCPDKIIPEIVTNKLKLKSSKTAVFLSQLFEIHQPKLWVFGHHHNTKLIQLESTIFICLNELDTLKLSEESNQIIFESPHFSGWFHKIG